MAEEEVNVRAELQRRKDAKQEHLKQVTNKGKPGMVMVVPQEQYRKSLKHIPSGVGFNPSGPAEWPYDQFTQRRLRDGSISIAPPEPEPEQEQQGRAAKKSQPADSNPQSKQS